MFSSLFKLLCACLQLISIHTDGSFKSESDIGRSIFGEISLESKAEEGPKGAS